MAIFPGQGEGFLPGGFAWMLWRVYNDMGTRRGCAHVQGWTLGRFRNETKEDTVRGLWGLVLAAAVSVGSGCSESSSEKVQSADQAKRVEGLRELSQERSGAALDVVKGAIGHEDAVTARAAVRAAGRMAGEESRAALEKTVRDDRRPEVRREAALALSGSRGPSLVASLRKVIETDPSPQVRAGAAISLGRVGGLDDVEFLVGVAQQDTDIEVQRQAVGALQRILGIGFTFDTSAPPEVRRLTLDRIRDSAMIRARVLREKAASAPAQRPSNR